MWTPLYVAIYKEHRDIVLLQLEGCTNTETQNDWDETALYMVSSLGHADIVWQLISHGADPNVECKDLNMDYNDVKWTPLHVVLFNGETPIIRILLEYSTNPNAPDDLGATALHLASCFEKVIESYSSSMARIWMSRTRKDRLCCTRQHTI